jgi:nicotinic acid mononucleotide adenylyltransferase
MSAQNIGVCWGTFDPPTLAHFNIMLSAISQGRLDKLIVVVNDNTGPKHYHTPGVERAAMIRKMLWDNHHQRPIEIMQHTPIEIIVQNDAYKVDDKLVQELNPDAQIIPIVGQDSFITGAKYCKAYDKVIVAPRGENEESSLLSTIEEHDLTNIHLLDLSSRFLTVSSTAVRDEVKRVHDMDRRTHEAKQPQIKHLVSSSTASYINTHYFFKDDFHAQHHLAAKKIQRTWRKHKNSSDSVMRNESENIRQNKH